MSTHSFDIDGFNIDGWRQHANCKGIATDLFYLERGCSAHDIKAAKAVCNNCTVIKQCLDYAVENFETVGIWGGTSEVERRSMRRNNKIINILEINHNQ